MNVYRQRATFQIRSQEEMSSEMSLARSALGIRRPKKNFLLRRAERLASMTLQTSKKKKKKKEKEIYIYNK